MAEEQTILNMSQAYVSSQRVVLAGTTYATRNITSVQVQPESSSGCGGALAAMLILTGLAGVFGASTLMTSGRLGPILGGVVLVAIGGLILRGDMKQKPNYALVLMTASGEIVALKSKDHPMLKTVEEAVIKAIVA